MPESCFLVFWMPLNHRLVSLKYTEFYAAYFIGENCEHNSFSTDTKSNRKLPKKMDNLYCFFQQKQQ